MDLNKFTQKSLEAVQNSQNIAIKKWNQSYARNPYSLWLNDTK